MSVTLVGKDRLESLLDDAPRVIVSNRTSLGNGPLKIAALTIAVHVNGTVRFRMFSGDPLASGESAVVNDDRPTEDNVLAIEAFLRLAVAGSGVIGTYVKLEPQSPATSLGDVELGIVDADDESMTGATPLDDAPGFAVFARSTQ